MSDTPFPCTKCGACCKMLDYAPGTLPQDLKLPNGTCRHLQPDNTCGIYETRPLECRMGETYRQSGLVQILTEPQWNAYVAHTSCKFSVETKGGELPPQGDDISAFRGAVWSRLWQWNYGRPHTTPDWVIEEFWPKGGA